MSSEREEHEILIDIIWENYNQTRTSDASKVLFIDHADPSVVESILQRIESLGPSVESG